MAAGQPTADGQNLRERYEKERKEELVIQRQSVVKLSRACSAVAGALMAALALAGVVSLASPELRAILAEIILEAVREMKGF